MMKQAILEKLLNMPLSSAQMQQIREDWKAFYDNPVDYLDTIVIDMVKLSLTSNR